MFDELSEDIIKDALDESEPSLDLDETTIVYLDQNKWGELRQARYSADSRYTDAYEAVDRSVNNGTAMYPFSLARLMETDEHADLEFRRQLYEIMIDFSNNFCLRNFFLVTKEERIAYIMNSIGLLPEAVLREKIFDRGLVAPLGLPRIQFDDGPSAEATETLHKLLRSERITRLMLEDDEYLIEGFEFQRQTDDYDLEHREHLRQKSKEAADNDEERWVIQLARNCLDNHLPPLHNIARQFNIDIEQHTIDDIRTRDSFEDFLAQFPAYYCFLVLSNGRDFHWNRELEANDLEDMMSLAVAIPYADIVVTEKFFAGVAYKHGLPDRYDTDVITDINQLPNLLGDT